MLFDSFVPRKASTIHEYTYARIMQNWTYLSSYLTFNKPDARTVGILLRLELDGKKRKDIINRLAARLGSQIRDILKQEVQDEYERVSSGKVSSQTSD